MEYPKLVTSYVVQKVELFFGSFKVYADFDLFYFLITHQNIWHHFVHTFLVIKSSIRILLTYYVYHLSNQWNAKQLSLHINF
jgi:hypothetical protein